MKNHLSESEIPPMRLNRWRREDLTPPRLPKRLSNRVAAAANLAHILAKILNENRRDRVEVSRNVLLVALSLARAVDEACNQPPPTPERRTAGEEP